MNRSTRPWLAAALMVLSLSALRSEEDPKGLSAAAADKYAELFMLTLDKSKYTNDQELVARSVKLVCDNLEANLNIHFSLRNIFLKNKDEHLQAEKNLLSLMGSDDAGDRARAAQILEIFWNRAMPPDPDQWRKFLADRRRAE